MRGIHGPRQRDMGRTYLRTLGDCEHHGVVLKITCASCGREAFAAPSEFLAIGKARIKRHTRLNDLQATLVCRGSQGVPGCGVRGAELRPLWAHEVPGIPAGVPVLPWLRADDRERKRLIRVARS